MTAHSNFIPWAIFKLLTGLTLYFLVKKCYNINMYNWSVDVKILKKDKRQYAIWKLEQMVNFGLNGQRVKISDLKKYWADIHIDPDRRKFLNLLLHGKKYSHQKSTTRSEKSSRK